VGWPSAEARARSFRQRVHRIPRQHGDSHSIHMKRPGPAPSPPRSPGRPRATRPSCAQRRAARYRSTRPSGPAGTASPRIPRAHAVPGKGQGAFDTWRPSTHMPARVPDTLRLRVRDFFGSAHPLLRRLDAGPVIPAACGWLTCAKSRFGSHVLVAFTFSEPTSPLAA
jgi:hypothetical protein